MIYSVLTSFFDTAFSVHGTPLFLLSLQVCHRNANLQLGAAPTLHVRCAETLEPRTPSPPCPPCMRRGKSRKRDMSATVRRLSGREG